MENRQFEAMLSVAQERLAQHAPEDMRERLARSMQTVRFH